MRSHITLLLFKLCQYLKAAEYLFRDILFLQFTVALYDEMHLEACCHASSYSKMYMILGGGMYSIWYKNLSYLPYVLICAIIVMKNPRNRCNNCGILLLTRASLMTIRIISVCQSSSLDRIFAVDGILRAHDLS